MSSPAPSGGVPTSTLDQNSLDRSLFQTLCIALVVGVILVGAWVILRRFFPRLYAPTLWRQTEDGPALVRMWAWLKPIFTINDEYIFKHRGFDALMYLTFTKMMITMLIAFFFYGIVILWPVDATAANRLLPSSDKHYINGTGILTMSDISVDTHSQDFKRFTAHLLSVVWNSVVAYILLARTYAFYCHWLERHRRDMDYSNYTVLMENIPRKLTEDQVKAQLDAQFPNEILAVHRVRTAYQLHSAYRERLPLYDIKESTQYDIDHDEEHERPEVRNTSFLFMIQCCFCWKPKIDKLEYVEQELQASNKRMEKLEGKLKNTNSVFVTFKTRDAAVRGLQTVFSHHGRRWLPHEAPDFNDIRWSSFEYSHRSRNVRYGIILFITFCIGIMFFIPITFAQGLANLATLARIPAFGWLVNTIEKFPVATQIVEGILPSLVITIGFVLVKVILSKMVLVERYFTRSNEFRSFSSKYFYLLVLNVFLASIAAGTFITLFNSIQGLLDNPLSIVRLLAMRLPTQVNFFINYIAVNSVISNLFPLLQPVRLLKRILFTKILGVKTNNTRAWLKTSAWQKYHEQYPVQMLYFTIAIAYSSLAPIIVPFALIFFLMKWGVGTYMALYVYKRRLESFGKYYPSIFNRLCVAILLYQTLMTGIFALTQFVAGIVICGILMCTTVIYALSVNSYFSDVVNRRSIETDVERKGEENPTYELLAQHYRDPMLDWRILEDHEFGDAIFYNTRDKLRQLQRSVHWPAVFERTQDSRQGFAAVRDENSATSPEVTSAGDVGSNDSPNEIELRDTPAKRAEKVEEKEKAEESAEEFEETEERTEEEESEEESDS